MKKVVFTVLLFVTTCSYTQTWRDTLMQAREAYALKRYDIAYKTYQRIGKSFQHKTDLSPEKAQSAYRNGEYHVAAFHYRKGLEKTNSPQQRATLHYNRGNACLKQNQLTEAIKAYKAALKIDPFNEMARYNLSHALRKKQKSKNDQHKNDTKTPNKTPKDNKKHQPNNKRPEPREKTAKRTPSSSASNKQEEHMVDHLLNKLIKDECRTKRKLNHTKIKRQGKTNNSSFDW